MNEMSSWKRQQTGDYQANDPEAIVGEIFSGGTTVAEAIERLRVRLLDLTARNRLLNYKHPRGRCVQICDQPNVDLVFNRLMGGKSIPFKFVPEPDPTTYEDKMPEVKIQASRIGIKTEFEFLPNSDGAIGRRLHGIQTLLYPTELERQLRKISIEAKTAIEETGTNMLFLIFGFLVFYESDDSDKPMMAPLLSLPVSLMKGDIDFETRTYQYTVIHNGEDIAENQTLREKIRRDFMFSLPEYYDNNEPEHYFRKIEKAVSKKHRWKVNRQITLGLLSFGKLSIWADLDTKKNPSLLTNELIKAVFSGGNEDNGGKLHAEDYRIDEIPEASLPLIYDADSSQHSVLIDVLSGKNMVVNGPPGTGKSQTITNIIALALSKGKKVLFVSEKLAALEVVRRRLNQAGLGHFCLELHSHKTQKKKILEDIQARISQTFIAPAQIEAKMTILQRQKTELARYAVLMGSKIGNALDLTVNEIFWAVERRRQELGDIATYCHAIGFNDASEWTHDDIESRKSRLEALAELYDSIGGYFGQNHPWWGFWPDALAPSEDEAVARIVNVALEHAIDANSAADEIVRFFGLKKQPDVGSAKMMVEMLEQLPQLPDAADTSLLNNLFNPGSDPNGQYSSILISEVTREIERARRLLDSAAEIFIDIERIPEDEMNATRQLCKQKKFQDTLLSSAIVDAIESVSKLDQTIEKLIIAASDSKIPFVQFSKSLIDNFIANCESIEPLAINSFPISQLAIRSSAVLDATKLLNDALSRIYSVTTKRSWQFDGTPEAIVRLIDSRGLPGLLSYDAHITDEILSTAHRFAAFFLADRTITELIQLKSQLDDEVSVCMTVFDRVRSSAERIGILFDYSERSITELTTVAKICASAPIDLLEYRRPTFGRAMTTELIVKVKSTLEAERVGRKRSDDIFYLDNLPPIEDIKSSITTLRSSEGFFSFFNGDWRKARKQYAGMSKEKRKMTSKQYAEELAILANWIEVKESFESDSQFRECFGGLFHGLKTDPMRIEKLNNWYVMSRATMAECPGLSERFDITTISSEKIAELSVKAVEILGDLSWLAGLEDRICGFLGSSITGFREAKSKGWDLALDAIRRVSSNIGKVAVFFGNMVDSKLTPKKALSLMKIKADLNSIDDDLKLLMNGQQVLQDAGGDELRRLVNFTGGPWADELRAISSKVTFVAEITSQALTFAEKTCPLSIAETFAKSINDIDEAWERVKCRAPWSRIEKCSDLAKAACEDAFTARKVLESILPYTRSGRSVLDVFHATDKEKEARSAIDKLSKSDEVKSMIGKAFCGLETDLYYLSSIHRWGSRVCSFDLPSEVRKRLLSGEAFNVLTTAKNLYFSVADGCKKSKESIESLSSYGTFSWDEWQIQVSGKAEVDLPSNIFVRIASVVNVQSSILSWSKYLSQRQLAKQESLGDFVEALETAKIPPSYLPSAFEFSSYQSIGRSIYQAHPELSGFNGSVHDKTRADYRILDAEIISLTGKDFASKINKCQIPLGHRGTTVREYTDFHLLRRELNKQSRHIPIRQLLMRAGAALQALKPCFMMGPLSVAQYLEQKSLRFDLVVMDEASQLRPEEAIGAIARGSQLVVVGDPKQLPPTSFFDRMMDGFSDEDEEDAPAVISGMESILDICQQLFNPVRSLRWHYRSQHESLIAFSNHHFYKNLIVFPSPYAKNRNLGVKYRFVRGGIYKDRKNVIEAQRVVDAVLEHMLKKADESLGVVTLNQTQRELIEDLLDKKLKEFTEGKEFMESWEAEGWPFFVKNLENVQGDERDVIFISTTFGRAPGTDKVRQNFGPISRPDGWRRLNVLFTRSKRRIELFTSMAPEDIVADERTPLGTKALRDYLNFAKRGVLVSTDENEREPDSDFEVSVSQVITSMGYEVKPQLGVAGFFIDIAVRNPDRPGEFLAGIECDGATYHSGFSVRDRDHIRQEIIESLGWKGRIYRIWSTDWFYDSRRAIGKLKEFLEERRRLSMIENKDWIEEDTNDEIDNSVDDQVAEIPDVGQLYGAK